MAYTAHQLTWVSVQSSCFDGQLVNDCMGDLHLLGGQVLPELGHTFACGNKKQFAAYGKMWLTPDVSSYLLLQYFVPLCEHQLYASFLCDAVPVHQYSWGRVHRVLHTHEPVQTASQSPVGRSCGVTHVKGSMVSIWSHPVSWPYMQHSHRCSSTK